MVEFVVSFYYYTDNRWEYRIKARTSAEAVVIACAKLAEEANTPEWCTSVPGKEHHQPFHIRVAVANK